MRIHWGMGIAIFYSAFMFVMIGIVMCSRSYEHALVSEHYYADDLRYQKHYDKLANALALEEDLRIEFSADRSGVMFDFPKGLKEIRGEVVFFRPSDPSSDFRVPLALDANNHQLIPVPGLEPGLWKVKVDWATPEMEFFKEQALVL